MDEAHRRVLLCELLEREIGHCRSSGGNSPKGVIGADLEVVGINCTFVPGGEDGDDAWRRAGGEERKKVDCEADTTVVLEGQEGFYPLGCFCGTLDRWQLDSLLLVLPSLPTNETYPGLMQRMSTRSTAFLISSLNLSTSFMSENSPS